MATASTCLKWVDVLENQFDKSWVDMDLLFNQIDDVEDDLPITSICRKHAASLASCFSQLAHKSTVVFQTNAKLEAELLHLREEIALCKQAFDKITSEKDYVTMVLQSTLIENHKLKFNQESEKANEEETKCDIKDKSDSDIKRISSISTSEDQVSKDSFISERLNAENAHLRTEIFELESELVGARLDNVYLDKELAGRIQQIQLLASNTPGELKERLWTQIEAEMCLQRAKTIAQICKTKQELRSRSTNSESMLTRRESVDEKISNGVHFEEKGHSKGKQVMVLKNPADDLGMAIIGGKEHNLPIIVSEIFPNSAVHRSSKLKAGDIILSVNGEDFSSVSHQEAVSFLSSLRGQITFVLQAAENMSEDDPSNLDFRFYKIFDAADKPPKIETSTPNKNGIATHPGRAVSSLDLDRISNIVPTNSTEIPTVHSPRRDLAKYPLADNLRTEGAETKTHVETPLKEDSNTKS